jgi:putative transposase
LVEPAGQRKAAHHLMKGYAMSERHACRLLNLARSTHRYKPHASGRNDVLRQRLRELAEKRPRFGYRRLHALLNREGWHANHKRIHRLYREERLSLRRRRRKHWMRTGRLPLTPPIRANERWSMDFVSDCAATGQTVRVLNIVDDHTRESLAVEVDTSLAAARVLRALERAIEERGKPAVIVCDNGPEFRGRALQAWSEQRNIRLAFIDPGKPIQNAFVESFNGRMRDECLNANWFLNVADARRKILAWRQDFNQQRPHSALGYRTPREYAASLRTSFNQETYIPDGT